MCVCVCVTGWTGCEVDGRMSGLVHRQTDKCMCVCVYVLLDGLVVRWIDPRCV